MDINQQRESKMKITLVISIAIIAVIVLFNLWIWKDQLFGPAVSTQTKVETAASDTSAVINRDVNNIDIGNLDKGFQGIDADLKQL